MKKITLILTLFILILTVQSYAQEVSPQTNNVDQIEYNSEKREIKRENKGNRKHTHMRNKHRKKVHKQHVKSMRNVAKADGKVTPEEKATIKRERKKMKHKGIERRKHVERKSRNRTIERSRR